MTIIYIGIAIAALAGILLFTKPGVLIKGFFGLFVKNIAQTPEGAEAIYQEAIEESQEKYNKAADALQRVSGALAGQKDTRERLLKERNNLDAQCKKLVRLGNDEQALIIAQSIQDLDAEIENCDNNIANLTNSVNDAKKLVAICEEELIKLKRESKLVVDNLRLNNEMAQAYNSLDELRRDGNVQKLLGHVRDGAQDAKNKAVGAKTVHENKISVQIAEAGKTARKSSASDYLSKIKDEMNGAPGFEVKEKINNKKDN